MVKPTAVVEKDVIPMRVMHTCSIRELKRRNIQSLKYKIFLRRVGCIGRWIRELSVTRVANMEMDIQLLMFSKSVVSWALGYQLNFHKDIELSLKMGTTPIN